MMAMNWTRRGARQQADALVCAGVSGWLGQVMAATEHTDQVVTLRAAEQPVLSAEAEVA
jgi:hypothetical protein